MIIRLSTALGIYLLVSFSIVAPSMAGVEDDSLRCGSDLIDLGETMYEVRKSCGEPYSIQDVGEKRHYSRYKSKRRSVESIVYLTEWIYERDDGIYVLTFEGSRLVEKEFIFQ